MEVYLAPVGAPQPKVPTKNANTELEVAARKFGVYLAKAVLESSQATEDPEHSYGGQSGVMVKGLYNQAVAEQLVGTNSLGIADLLIEQSNFDK